MHSRANAYRNVSVTSATPERTLDEVFRRALAACREAADGIKRGDVAGKGRAIGQALSFVGALACSLDNAASPEVCENLARLYRFVCDRLTQANLHKRVEPLAEAEQVLSVLRDAFREAAAR